YCNEVFHFLETNKMNDTSVAHSHVGCNVLFEQILFATWAEHNNHKVKNVIEHGINDNGYTFNDYRNSVEHYLQKGDALKKIHLRARKSIIKQRDKLNEQLRRTPANRERWWAEDSIMTKHVNTLWKEPYLRNFKWLSGTSAKEEWNPTDSVAFDIPSNPIWWENTIMANTGNSPADSLYPILQRDYLIYTERIERQRLLEKDYTPQQKARKRIQERKKAKPDMAKYEISKKMEKEKLKKRTK
ncbi:MAG: hypothetical protein IIW25_05100, partial [Bacteroidales bacterium]|nr:hypothetical protein [Bacteroidales bacterium]